MQTLITLIGREELLVVLLVKSIQMRRKKENTEQIRSALRHCDLHTDDISGSSIRNLLIMALIERRRLRD